MSRWNDCHLRNRRNKLLSITIIWNKRSGGKRWVPVLSDKPKHLIRNDVWFNLHLPLNGASRWKPGMKWALNQWELNWKASYRRPTKEQGRRQSVPLLSNSPSHSVYLQEGLCYTKVQIWESGQSSTNLINKHGLLVYLHGFPLTSGFQI